MKRTTEDKRIETRASHTALMAAIYRFLATREKEQGFKGPDSMAYMFMPPKAKFFLSITFFRNLIKKKLNRKSPGSYQYVTARTRFFDDLFVKEVRQNIPQMVFLGAGYDTRSIRFHELLQETRIFELDVPTTQEEKIRILRKNKTVIPENLHYVPINFNADDLKQTLLAAGYDPSKRTLFIWEGVTMYITDEAVDETLSFVKNNSGEGSAIVFDYLYKSVIRNECSYFGAKEISEIVRKTGEPFTFGIEEKQIEEFLSTKGFMPELLYDPEEFEKEYLFNSKGELFGKMYGFAGHVYARKLEQ